MRILTSYYNKINEEFVDAVLVRISRTQPKDFTEEVYECKELYPDWELINLYKSGDIDEEDYKHQYSKQLTNKLRSKLLKRFERLCESHNTDTVILLCWEHPKNFCHRHIAGPWLSETCKELNCSHLVEWESKMRGDKHV